MLTCSLVFCTSLKKMPLAFGILSLRNGKLYFGILSFVSFFFLLLLVSWREAEGELSSSLSSRSLGGVRPDRRPRRFHLPDLTASGTGFWVMNRLSTESLRRHNYMVSVSSSRVIAVFKTFSWPGQTNRHILNTFKCESIFLEFGPKHSLTFGRLKSPATLWSVHWFWDLLATEAIWVQRTHCRAQETSLKWYDDGRHQKMET